MFGSLSIESQIITLMASPEIDCTASFVSGLCEELGAKFSQAKLSQGLNGLRPLSNQDALYVLGVLKKMQKAAQLSPFPISFRNPKIIAALLKDIDEGVLKICVIRNELLPQEKSFVLRFRNGMYFSHQDRNGQAMETINPGQGLKMVRPVALELVKVFEGMGYRDCTIEQSFDGDPKFELEQAWKSSAVAAR